MDRQDITDEILLEYIDGNLEKDERRSIESILAKDNQLTGRLDELKKIDSMLNSTSIQKPSDGFTQRVMMNLHTADKKFKRGSIWILLIGLLTIAVGSFYMTEGVVNVHLSDPAFVQEFVDSTIININTSFNFKIIGNLILAILALLTLLLFDRAVLKPYFKDRGSYSY